ncbi:hypothetical protein O181_025873 [Austropuccinia psidii MF-1]|uniref:Uncharacterized protein n=1 Tax=Austropuccinia psidii MF-1 TaxID=1389203 RepID=A0A9Q3GZI4_9BASI|nr:hypothetical protein [Austropuccinia psidii MF-1]
MAIFYGPMDPLELWHRGSSNPHRPQTIGHAKDQRTQSDQKGPRRPKRPLITIPSQKGHGNGRKQNFRPNFKDNGDKPPSWMIPKANQGEEEPRGTISQSIMGIYAHITIMNPFLR